MDNFPSIEEVHSLLDEIAEEIPKDFFNELNGGILLLPDHKLHPESRSTHKLYIMGEYQRSSNSGRLIIIYYGSFKKVHPRISKAGLYQLLKDTLLHEFTHHLESLAGERALEVKDAYMLESYKQQYKKD
ncbi:metallopeptidase family protein [Alkaliphilus serpentinus]|uniref:Metallopeptidase family protein n=1 Tax=Alkaliphilus serpentinus TaxID=1482731 RepID=A0A833M8R1_9FIRM|nr:metallopeptidase family protein [Alkaliphilus serpentinus]KAB3525509.1 metallopeptidase family protein [Alkaliphilus serpentinus]